MEEEQDPIERKRMLQDMRREITRRLEGIQDEFLLNSVLEMLDDAESDLMEGEKDPELVEASEYDQMHPDNRRKPAPINRPNKNNADDWLDGLGR